MSDPASTAPEHSTATVGCNCIDLTNEALREHNCELSLAFEIDRQTGVIQTTVALHTTLLEKKRGARALNILASFCPFCGARYGAHPPASTEDAQ